MDRKERSPTFQQALRESLDGRQAEIWTGMPGIIQSFDPAKRTCVVQPAIMAQVMKPDNTFVWEALPLLLDCPVIFPGGGGFVLTFPLKAGDEVFVNFGNRCIDQWYQSGGIQIQAELRMHSLSDGFVLAGVSSLPNVQPAISTANVQLRSDDGSTFVELTPAGNARLQAPGNVDIDAGGNADVTADGSITLNAPVVNINAAAAINMTAPTINITTPGAGGLSIDGIPFGTHKHPILGGSSAPGPTGGPVA